MEMFAVKKIAQSTNLFSSHWLRRIRYVCVKLGRCQLLNRYNFRYDIRKILRYRQFGSQTNSETNVKLNRMSMILNLVLTQAYYKSVIFGARLTMLERAIAKGRSVCLSLRLSHSWFCTVYKPIFAYT